MSYMSDPGLSDQIVSLTDDRGYDHRPDPRYEQPKAGVAKAYRLRRPGARPIVFHGGELGMAMSFSPEMSYWYEINLFRTVGQTFVLAIKTFFQGESEKDLVEAWSLSTLSEAIDALEAYDPAHNIRVVVNASDPSLTAPELAAHAMDLRSRTEAARRHFAGLVGEFLYQIDLTS